MTPCENFDTFSIPDICKIMSMENQLWSDMWAKIEPKLKCPINKSSMKIRNATVDLGLIAYLPLDGYTWTISFKSYQPIRKERNKKQLLYCGLLELNVTKMQRGRKNHLDEVNYAHMPKV